MFYLFSTLISSLWLSHCQTAVKLPNIDYLAAGYNIIFGNPHVWNGEMDPGFAIQKIYNFTYSGAETSDGKYLLPDNVAELTCVSDCTIDTIYYDYTGVSRYVETLSEEASVSGSYNEIFESYKFSGSVDFQTVQKSTEYDHHVFTSIYAKCCAYAAANDQFLPPELSDNFLAAVEEMPTDFNSSDNSQYFFYNEFIPSFGTHAVIQVEMGSRFGQISNFERFAYSSYSSSNLDISVSAQASCLEEGGCASSMTDYSLKEANYFSQATDYQKIYFVGASFPANQSGEQWLYDSQNNPNAITYQLQPLPNLLVPLYFPNINKKILLKKQEALVEAYENYCSMLLSQGLITSCAYPPPDGPLPSSSIFRGMYSFPVDASSTNMQPNPYTNEYNCPVGFKSYEYGYLGDGDHNVTLYVCLNETTMATGNPKNIKDPMNFYGGSYQKIDNKPYIDNPMTKNNSCGEGMFRYQMSYAEVENKNGYIYWCVNQTTIDPNGVSILGGFYQTCKAQCPYVTNNYFTQAQSCPADFKAYKVAFGQINKSSSDDNKQGSIYACLSNIYDMS